MFFLAAIPTAIELSVSTIITAIGAAAAVNGIAKSAEADEVERKASSVWDDANRRYGNAMRREQYHRKALCAALAGLGRKRREAVELLTSLSPGICPELTADLERLEKKARECRQRLDRLASGNDANLVFALCDLSSDDDMDTVIASTASLVGAVITAESLLALGGESVAASLCASSAAE